MGRLQLSRFDKLSVTLCFEHAILTLHPEPEPALDLIGGRALSSLVMPAQAGIQPVFFKTRLPSLILDSRLLGNDFEASS